MIECVSTLARVVILLGFMSLFSGCATPMTLPLKESGGHFRPVMESGKGYVYLYREAEFTGAGRGIYITANGRRIGGLNSGTYFVYETEPSEVVIAAENWLEGDSKSRRKLMVEAGKKYFLRGSLKRGSWDAQPHIEIVNELEGEQAVQALKYATLE